MRSVAFSPPSVAKIAGVARLLYLELLAEGFSEEKAMGLTLAWMAAATERDRRLMELAIAGDGTLTLAATRAASSPP